MFKLINYLLFYNMLTTNKSNRDLSLILSNINFNNDAQQNNKINYLNNNKIIDNFNNHQYNINTINDNICKNILIILIIIILLYNLLKKNYNIK